MLQELLLCLSGIEVVLPQAGADEMSGGLNGALHLSTSHLPNQRGPDQVRLRVGDFCWKTGLEYVLFVIKAEKSAAFMSLSHIPAWFVAHTDTGT